VSLSEEKERGWGWGLLNEEACEQRCPKEEKGEGVQYRDKDRHRELTRVPERRGSLCERMRRARHNIVATREWAHMGPTIDGIRRALDDSDSTCVAWSHRT
jgi:hypothetical protein